MFILACILRTFKPQTLVSAFLKCGCSKWSNKPFKNYDANEHSSEVLTVK